MQVYHWRHLTIWLEENAKKKQELLKQCQATWNLCIPEELQNFYECMNKYLNKKIKFSNHVNKYYQKNNEIVAWFPYPSDNFLLHYFYGKNIIILYGNKMNLERILLDFMTVTNTYLPLHASSVQKGNKVIGLLSESGGGKTSLVLQLLQKDFSFVADDSLFANQNTVIPVSDIISVRKSFPNHPIIKKVVSSHKEEKIFIHLREITKIAKPSRLASCTDWKFYLLQKQKSSWQGLANMEEPFPAISRHSFWCLHYFVPEHQKQFIENKIGKSFSFWEKKLEKIEPISINWQYFEEYVEDFANRIG